MESLIDTYKLTNKVRIPIIGFGTWQTPAGDVAKIAVKSALTSGYRHIDTAEMYGNEQSVGAAIKESGIARQRIFLTSKLNNHAHSYQAATAAIEQSLKDLQVDYLDLFLIHWPNPKPARTKDWEKNLQETWRALEDAYQSGKIKSIGVSNFRTRHFKVLSNSQKIQPMVNQIRICPGDVDHETIDYCRHNDILIEAYSPLGTGKIFSNSTLKKIAAKNQRSVAQVCLRWSLQHKFLPLPKSIHENRIEENTQLFDFTLSTTDMQEIDKLDGIVGYAPNPDTVDF